MTIVLKSGILKLLEPSGPVQVFNGNDLPLTNQILSQNFLMHSEM